MDRFGNDSMKNKQGKTIDRFTTEEVETIYAKEAEATDRVKITIL